MPSYSDPRFSLQVLYEDNHLIAVFKPAGVLVQGDSSGERCLMDYTRQWLMEKYSKPGRAFLGLVHRLDRPVCGVVIFAKTSKGASRLSAQIRSRSVRKVYWALAEGTPSPSSQVLEQPIEGKPARLRFQVLDSYPQASLIEIELETGRKHQIRIQLSSLGHPILGDTKYGAKRQWGNNGIALVAKRFEFQHPIRSDEKVIVELPERLCPLRRGPWE